MVQHIGQAVTKWHVRAKTTYIVHNSWLVLLIFDSCSSLVWTSSELCSWELFELLLWTFECWFNVGIHFHTKLNGPGSWMIGFLMKFAGETLYPIFFGRPIWVIILMLPVKKLGCIKMHFKMAAFAELWLYFLGLRNSKRLGRGVYTNGFRVEEPMKTKLKSIGSFWQDRHFEILIFKMAAIQMRFCYISLVDSREWNIKPVGGSRFTLIPSPPPPPLDPLAHQRTFNASKVSQNYFLTHPKS